MSNNNLYPFYETCCCPECGEAMDRSEEPVLELCNMGNTVVAYQWHHCPGCDEDFELTVEYSRFDYWLTKND